MFLHSFYGRSPVLPVLCLLFVLLHACARPDETLNPNKPPTIWLASAPPEGSVNTYTVKLFWGGWDPDGEIAYYEYCITDNDKGSFNPSDTTGDDRWRRVNRNDSTFLFSADLPATEEVEKQVTEFRRSHTFFIRSVDNEGTSSQTPAYRSFTARTLSPKVVIKQPLRIGQEPANVPPISTFKWIATDYDDSDGSEQDPDSVSRIFEPIIDHNNSWLATIDWIRKLPVESPEWGQWQWYGAPGDSGKFWTTPPTPVGMYVFAIRVLDEAGAITPVFDEKENVRRIEVSDEILGPQVTVRNKYLGSVTGVGGNVPITIMDLPSGLPVVFSWDATAAGYAGTAVGYRYGWDVIDPADPEAWAVDWTPFSMWKDDGREIATARSKAARWQGGVHVFTLEVQDNSGYVSNVEIKLNIVQFTKEKNVLLVDDFDEGPRSGWRNVLSKGVLPNDEEHDRFWNDVLGGVLGFDPASDVIEARGGQLIPLVRFAQYKAVIWCVRGHVDQSDKFPLLHDLVLYRPRAAVEGAGRKVFPNLLSLFMAAGGKVFICGEHPVSMSINKQYAPGLRYPVIFKYELDGLYSSQEVWPNAQVRPPADESFAWQDLCVETMDFAVTEYRRRRKEAVCPIYTLRTVPPEGFRDHSMRAAQPLDVSFPRLELRVETAGPGRAHDPLERGLNAEVYNPAYFFDSCGLVYGSRDCFEPIYGLDCFDTAEPVYGQPVAFWSRVYTDDSEGNTGLGSARSVVWGFLPALFTPEQVYPAIELILFDEWGLPRE
jgi:hypothetical protein